MGGGEGVEGGSVVEGGFGGWGGKSAVLSGVRSLQSSSAALLFHLSVMAVTVTWTLLEEPLSWWPV